MKCPWCGQEMTIGYLRGSRGYDIMWTDDPFKATDMTLGEDFWLCKLTDPDKPKAHLCKSCRRIVMDITEKDQF